VPLESSPESPLPVRTVAAAIAGWVARLGRVWVDGQVTQVDRRGGTAFLTLRDVAADVSLRVTCPRNLVDEIRPPLAEGARVVLCGRPQMHLNRGSLSLVATTIRPLGVGELLERLERLRAALAAEGLFAPQRKRPLPFLPGVVGLVTGRAGAAEHDVVTNARRRWPGVRFRVLNVAVQGPAAVAELAAAIRLLDADTEVDVIVLARGGGSVEDLLPFSDETLCRAVAGCRTPVVSAIGHEGDSPLVDLVADARASTPTDAAKLVVPDFAAESAAVTSLRRRARRALDGRLHHEAARLAELRRRPVLARPGTLVDGLAAELAGLRSRGRRCAGSLVDAAAADLAHARARVAALSPAATLARGYAVLQKPGGEVVRDAAALAVGDPVRARLAAGAVDLSVTSTESGAAATGAGRR
jgi:exodeoxyribonuclease VII large subunit